jgi:hypothetical protein
MSDLLTPPPQRQACGKVMPDGTVMFFTDWYNYLAVSLFRRNGGYHAPTNSELDDGLQFDIREADLAELTKRVIALEVEDMRASDAARIAELEKRVADLEHARADQLTAQLAEAIKRIDSLESAGSFA